VSEPLTPREKRAQERAQRIREYRERNAASTGRYQRGRTLFLAGLIGLIGLFMTGAAMAMGSGYGIVGGLLIIGGAVLMVVADRHRVETVNPEDRPEHRRELVWFLLAAAAVVVGFVLTIHPW
jgi:hypothetical protein